MAGLLVMVASPPDLHRLVLVNSPDRGQAVLATKAALRTAPDDEVAVVGTVEDAALNAFRVPPNEARLAF